MYVLLFELHCCVFHIFLLFFFTFFKNIISQFAQEETPSSAFRSRDQQVLSLWGTRMYVS